jgi:hypothetical protein
MSDDPNAPMTDSTPPPPPGEPAESAAEPQAGPTASEAWADVVARMGELGAAMSAWAKAAADNPDNRRHLDEVRSGVNDMAGKAEAAFAEVAASDFGQQVKAGATEAGEAIGDAAQKVSAAAAPHVASAFAGLADVFGRAAHKVGEAADRQSAATPAPPAQASDAPAPDPAAPAPPTAPEPPARDE